MTTKKVKPEHGMSTIVNHVGEGGHHKHAHLMPRYQTSTFGFDTVGIENIEDLIADLGQAMAKVR